MAAHPTPLERSAFQRIPNAARVTAYLRRLAAAHADVDARTVGRSAGRRLLAALFIDVDGPADGRLTILLVGAQHGREQAGGEALQIIARDLLGGDLAPLRQRFRFIILPLANPDGRDLETQANGRGVNLNSDYAALSQPESRALAALVRDHRPHVVLDVHESAIFKRRTLGADGYLADFEAQFDALGHPMADTGLRRYAVERFLPAAIGRVVAAGTPARRYTGEPGHVGMPLGHGGLGLKKFRNYAGLHGCLAVVLENRLDPKDADYPTPRNIARRVAKQCLSIRCFLDLCDEERRRIEAVVAVARGAVRQRLPIVFGYVADPKQPTISLPLRRLDTGRRVRRRVPYQGRVRVERWQSRGTALAVTAHRSWIADLLDRHAIAYVTIRTCRSVHVLRRKVTSVERDDDGALLHCDIIEQPTRLTLRPGDLWIDLGQPLGGMAALLLDPRATDSLFRHPRYADLLAVGCDTGVHWMR